MVQNNIFHNLSQRKLQFTAMKSVSYSFAMCNMYHKRKFEPHCIHTAITIQWIKCNTELNVPYNCISDACFSCSATTSNKKVTFVKGFDSIQRKIGTCQQSTLGRRHFSFFSLRSCHVKWSIFFNKFSILFLRL